MELQQAINHVTLAQDEWNQAQEGVKTTTDALAGATAARAAAGTRWKGAAEALNSSIDDLVASANAARVEVIPDGQGNA